MKSPKTKKQQRLEKKKKKMAALLEIVKLNDEDRMFKMKQTKMEQTDSMNDLNKSSEILNNEKLNRKRSCSTKVDETNNSTSDEIKDEENTTIKEDKECDRKKPRLSEEEYLKLKQELKERKKLLKARPRLQLKPIGGNACLVSYSSDVERVPLLFSDIQNLLLYSILGHHSPCTTMRWCQLEKYNKITHTIVFVVEGLTEYHFMSYESVFSSITSNLEFRLEVFTPSSYGSTIIEELIAVPLSRTQSDKLIKQFGSLDTAFQNGTDMIRLMKAVFPVNIPMFKNNNDLPSTDKFSRVKLLLSIRQMVEENYPVPIKGDLARKYRDYIFTKDSYLEVTAKSPMLGLDCEMCKTDTGNLELTRISLVDESYNVIYDTLVKPKNQIIDYLTQYSGITKELLSDVTTTLADVQKELKKIIPPDCILVGQSLNSDLHTLKMMHPYIIDTSVIFNITGERHRKSKLQLLAKNFLGVNIQQGTKGHCSTEDSQASMKLVQLKLANSIDFGDAVIQADLQVCETIKFAKEQRTATIVGTEEIINEYSKYLSTSSLKVKNDENYKESDQIRLVTSDNNKHAVERATEIAIQHQFVLCHVKISEEKLQNERLKRTFSTVNKWINKLWDHTATNGLACVVFSGQENGANGACFLNVKKQML
ncbi:PREDICTED: RNA exonuclease 1 isoform X2 [Polistes dominula]|uniref:RNA exonuclease 1 isoform X2 n=1 Tax=Polistes dominula TaxID=743375 RepID=A0ABM1IS14_POLDO|nr:PREDICTED: RNA exonuclease 1 isoform X2 [Polistes dominula]